jgi:hypothetical protein
MEAIVNLGLVVFRVGLVFFLDLPASLPIHLDGR